MAYTSDSAADRLAAVRAAIDRCLTSQEYSIGARRQRTAELRDLRAMERDLMDEIEAGGGSGTMAGLVEMERPR